MLAVTQDQKPIVSPQSILGQFGPLSSNSASGSLSGPMVGASSASAVPRFASATLFHSSSSTSTAQQKHFQAQAIPASMSGPSLTPAAAATPQTNFGTSSNTRHATPIVASNSTIHHPVQRPPTNTPTAPRAGPAAPQVAGPSSIAHVPTMSASGLPSHPLPQKPKAMAPMPRYRTSHHAFR